MAEAVQVEARARHAQWAPGSPSSSRSHCPPATAWSLRSQQGPQWRAAPGRIGWHQERAKVMAIATWGSWRTWTTATQASAACICSQCPLDAHVLELELEEDLQLLQQQLQPTGVRGHVLLGHQGKHAVQHGARLSSGPTSSGLTSHVFSTMCTRTWSGTSTTRHTVTLTIYHPRSCRATSSTSSILT